MLGLSASGGTAKAAPLALFRCMVCHKLNTYATISTGQCLGHQQLGLEEGIGTSLWEKIKIIVGLLR